MEISVDSASYDLIDDTHIIALIAGYGDEGYLILQRLDRQQSEDDKGIYLEMNEQDNSGYGLLKSFSVKGRSIEVKLRKSIAGVESLMIDASQVVQSEFDDFLIGLKKIFGDFENMLSISSATRQ